MRADYKVCWDPQEEFDDETDCLELKDVNMVAQLLKAFFRELPEPLVPFGRVTITLEYTFDAAQFKSWWYGTYFCVRLGQD